jgi:hypothetical protein
MNNNSVLKFDELKAFQSILKDCKDLYWIDTSDFFSPHRYSEEFWEYLTMFSSRRECHYQDYLNYTPEFVQKNLSTLCIRELENSIFHLVRAEKICSGAIASNIKNKNIERIICQLIEIW